MNTTRLIPWPVAVLAAFFCSATGLSAQSILLSAGNFTLLGSTAITNTGATNIATGDVGSQATVSGFPPGTVSGGAAIIGTGPIVDQGIADLVTVSTGLAAMTANTNLTGQDLAGMTLTPGVYKFNVAAALNGALVLDANFQNNAFWVFQIGTALTTSMGSSVTLINAGTNGGSDDGIFWDAGAAITFGSANQILGNYLAGTSITFGGTTSGVGGARGLAQAGVSLDSNLIDSNGGPDGSDWTGGLMYDGSGNIVPITVPEPAAFLWLAPLGALAFVVWRRRSVAKKQAA